MSKTRSLLACLAAAAFAAAPARGGMPPAAAGGPDFALKMSLGQSAAALNAAFTAKSAFPGQVQAAYEGYEDGVDVAPRYLDKGKELREIVAVVQAQLDAVYADTSQGRTPDGTAWIRRRAAEARDMVQLYLVLPRDVAGLDAKDGREDLRALFVRAMTKIAEDGDYASAGALRIRAVEGSRRPQPRR